ncbi:MAG: hypothetical protein RJA44_629 [Pseudomonadota bacterium]
MNFLLDNWIWIVTALVSGAMLMIPVIKGGGAGISPAEAVQLMNRAKAVVIDVCEPAEHAASHIRGARNVPLAQIEASKELPGNKALPLVVVCASGVRANRAAGTLRQRGHEQVHVLQGGMNAWREAGLPTEKTA